MKHILSLLIFGLGFITLNAQSDRIKNLEGELKKAKGIIYFQKAIQLSEWYLEEKYYLKAANAAEDAYDMGNELQNDYLKALALNRQAKALGAKENGKFIGQARAIKKFKESLKLLENSNDVALKVDNLEHLRDLADGRDRDAVVAEISKKIAVLKGEKVPDIAVDGKNKSKTELKNENAQLSQQVASLNEESEKVKKEKEELAKRMAYLDQEKQKLAKESKSLSNMVTQQKAAITNMTEAQAKSELLLSKQKNMLDSLAFSKLIDSIQLNQQTLKLQQKESELQEEKAQAALQRSQRNLLLALAGIILLLAGGLYYRYQTIHSHNKLLEEKNKIIREEKHRSEELLLNILPAAIADELKLKGFAAARRYENATVLFTDFQNFSKISEKLSPEELVEELDYCFKAFDSIISKYHLEKIKTIGDAYMCAGGIPSPSAEHPYHVIQAALEIQQFLNTWKAQRIKEGKPYFEARIGIHTGPLVAGVVGDKKFAYDIWGDTVNLASRMESSGEPGKVNVSGSTYALIKDKYTCVHRGKIPAKNKGEIDMYFVQGEAFG